MTSATIALLSFFITWLGLGLGMRFGFGFGFGFGPDQHLEARLRPPLLLLDLGALLRPPLLRLLVLLLQLLLLVGLEVFDLLAELRHLLRLGLR